MSMELDEMMSALRMTNKKCEKPIPEKVLKEVLALVIKNPLEKDRLKCQEQIQLILSQRSGDE